MMRMMLSTRGLEDTYSPETKQISLPYSLSVIMAEPKPELMFSNLVLIKRVFYTLTFAEGVTFEQTCAGFQKPVFEPFRYAEEQVFSEHRRNIREAIRTFEVFCYNNLRSLDLGKSEIRGQLRIFVTIYRAGFVALSIAYYFASKNKSGEVREKTVCASTPLTSAEVRSVIDDQRFDEKTGRRAFLEYVIGDGEKILRVEFYEFLELLLKRIEEKGLKVGRKSPMRRTIYLHEPEFQDKSIDDIVQEYNKELFTIFATATDAQLKRLSEERRVEQLESCLHKTSDFLGFFLDEVSMLIVARKKRTHFKMRSPLIWVHQLILVQEFLISVYSLEAGRLAVSFANAVRSRYYDLFGELLEIRETFLLSLEDLYYVEGTLFRLQSDKLVSECKELFGFDRRVEVIQKRLDSVKSRIQEALRAREQESLERREKSIAVLSLVFATFGFGQIVSAFMIWYLSSILSGQNVDIAYLLGGLVITSFSMLLVFIFSRWYINRNTAKEKKRGAELL